jgi:hypothetical protein
VNELYKNPPNKACTGRWGFCGVFEHFPRFEFFLLPSRIHARPSASTLKGASRTQTVGQHRKSDFYETIT